MPFKDKEDRRAYSRAASRRYRERNLEKTRARGRDYYWKNKERLNTNTIEKRRNDAGYNSRVNARLNAAKERLAGRVRPDFCDICGGPPLGKKGLHFDHCHQRGHFRGWLCSNCNTALGLVRDDVNHLRKLIAYLQRTSRNTAPQMSLHGI